MEKIDFLTQNSFEWSDDRMVGRSDCRTVGRSDGRPDTQYDTLRLETYVLNTCVVSIRRYARIEATKTSSFLQTQNLAFAAYLRQCANREVQYRILEF